VVSARFSELDFRSTPRGDVSLRRRRDPVLEAEVFEVLLGDEYLMSSAFTAGEEQLALLALAELSGDTLDVVVGGLGLGYTAMAAGMLNGDVLPPGLTRMSGRHLEGLPCK
jgi:hypothetical protein